MLAQAAKSLIKRPLDYGAHWWGPHRGQPQAPQLWILTYHRILPRSDPRYALEEPGMVVEPKTFAMHMDLIREHFTIVSLQEWLQRRDSGQALPLKSCAITFDDGWLDNFEYAFPILKEQGIPATIFVVTHMIGSKDHFWPNRLGQVLASRPEALRSLPLAPHNVESISPRLRGDKLSRLVQQLKEYPDPVINQWLNDIDTAPSVERSLMNWDELREMVASGLVDVGSHGCHHYRLDNLDAKTIAREIVESKRRLEEELPRSVQVFCYPNGDSSPLARDLVAEHYKAAVTTSRGINSSRGLKPLELLRIAIHEDRCNTVVKLSSRLANWY